MVNRKGPPGVGTRDYEIFLALPEDIPGILTLQDPNVMDRGGGAVLLRDAQHAIIAT